MLFNLFWVYPQISNFQCFKVIVIDPPLCFLYMRWVNSLWAKIYKVVKLLLELNQVFMLSSTKKLFGLDNLPNKKLHVSSSDCNKVNGMRM